MHYFIILLVVTVGITKWFLEYFLLTYIVHTILTLFLTLSLFILLLYLNFKYFPKHTNKIPVINLDSQYLFTCIQIIEYSIEFHDLVYYIASFGTTFLLPEEQPSHFLPFVCLALSIVLVFLYLEIYSLNLIFEEYFC